MLYNDCSSKFILAVCGWDGPCGPLVGGVPWQGKWNWMIFEVHSMILCLQSHVCMPRSDCSSSCSSACPSKGSNLLVQMAFVRIDGSASHKPQKFRLLKAWNTETHSLREEISNQVKVELRKCPPCLVLCCEKNKKRVLCRWAEAWEDAGGQSISTVLCWESDGNASVRGKY